MTTFVYRGGGDRWDQIKEELPTGDALTWLAWSLWSKKREYRATCVLHELKEKDGEPQVYSPQDVLLILQKKGLTPVDNSWSGSFDKAVEGHAVEWEQKTRVQLLEEERKLNPKSESLLDRLEYVNRWSKALWPIARVVIVSGVAWHTYTYGLGGTLGAGLALAESVSTNAEGTASGSDFVAMPPTATEARRVIDSSDEDDELGSGANAGAAAGPALGQSSGEPSSGGAGRASSARSGFVRVGDLTDNENELKKQLEAPGFPNLQQYFSSSTKHWPLLEKHPLFATGGFQSPKTAGELGYVICVVLLLDLFRRESATFRNTPIVDAIADYEAFTFDVGDDEVKFVEGIRSLIQRASELCVNNLCPDVDLETFTAKFNPGILFKLNYSKAPRGGRFRGGEQQDSPSDSESDSGNLDAINQPRGDFLRIRAVDSGSPPPTTVGIYLNVNGSGSGLDPFEIKGIARVTKRGSRAGAGLASSAASKRKGVSQGVSRKRTALDDDEKESLGSLFRQIGVMKVLTREELKRLTLGVLKERLKELGLDTRGNKPALVKRLWDNEFERDDGLDDDEVSGIAFYNNLVRRFSNFRGEGLPNIARLCDNALLKLHNDSVLIDKRKETLLEKGVERETRTAAFEQHERQIKFLKSRFNELQKKVNNAQNKLAEEKRNSASQVVNARNATARAERKAQEARESENKARAQAKESQKNANAEKKRRRVEVAAVRKQVEEQAEEKIGEVKQNAEKKIEAVEKKAAKKIGAVEKEAAKKIGARDRTIGTLTKQLADEKTKGQKQAGAANDKTAKASAVVQEARSAQRAAEIATKAAEKRTKEAEKETKAAEKELGNALSELAAISANKNRDAITGFVMRIDFDSTSDSDSFLLFARGQLSGLQESVAQVRAYTFESFPSDATEKIPADALTLVKTKTTGSAKPRRGSRARGRSSATLKVKGLLSPEEGQIFTNVDAVSDQLLAELVPSSRDSFFDGPPLTAAGIQSFFARPQNYLLTQRGLGTLVGPTSGAAFVYWLASLPIEQITKSIGNTKTITLAIHAFQSYYGPSILSASTGLLANSAARRALGSFGSTTLATEVREAYTAATAGGGR